MAAPAKLPPGPRYPALIQGVGFWTRPLAYLERCRARYGPRFTIRLPASPPFVMLTRPGEIKEVLLDARHEDGSSMSAQELREELLTLLIAGHEITASSLAWAFQCLAADRRALAALRSGVDTDGSESAYLLATIYETLRHRPVLPNGGPRLVLEPIDLGGVMYPPGGVPGSQRLPSPPRLRPLPRSLRVQARAMDAGRRKGPHARDV